MKRKKKSTGLKTKLWFKIKKEAKSWYKIYPEDDSDMYDVYAWTECGFWEVAGPYTLDEAKEVLAEYRERKFKELCNKALYYRRRERVMNL